MQVSNSREQSIPRRDLLARRLRAQLLSGTPAGSVVEVVGQLLAVQAQDPRGMRLAVRSRSAGLVASDVDRALTEDRSVVVSTLNRGTLHLVLAQDYWWLHALTTPHLVIGNARRLRQEQVTEQAAERALVVIEATLSNHGPRTRAQLRAVLADAGIRVEGQALPHLLMLAALRGLVVRGPVVGREQAFVLVRDWLGTPPDRLDRDEALTLLAGRYLAGHGPAEPADLAKWAGITLGAARTALARTAALGPDHRDEAAPAELPPPRLLGSFDPSLLGWASREFIVGGHRELVTTNGIFRPFAMVDGVAVGAWTLTGGQLTWTPFARITKRARIALDADAAAVLGYLEA